MHVILRAVRKREDAFENTGVSEVVQVLFIGERFDCRVEPNGSHFLHLPFSGMKVKIGLKFKAVL
jgi:hypothetical protein